MSQVVVSVPEPGVEVNSRIAFSRSQPLVYRNSRILCWLTLSLGVLAVFMAACMMLVIVSLMFPISAFSLGQVPSIFWSAIGALSMGALGSWLWRLVRAMANYRVLLDSRGATFSLGSAKKPQDLFLAWDQMVAIRQRRVGNAQQFSVLARNGSEIVFSSYTFFRPRKVARLIGERTGLTISKSSRAERESVNPERGR
jgi:hypothetical protein